jgi:hypothetical protein
MCLTFLSVAAFAILAAISERAGTMTVLYRLASWLWGTIFPRQAATISPATESEDRSSLADLARLLAKEDNNPPQG